MLQLQNPICFMHFHCSGSCWLVAMRKRNRADLAAAAIGWAQSLSSLAHCLLTKWAWGKISAVNVQAIAHSARLSGCLQDDIRGLALLGNYGMASNNCHRDLLQKVSSSLAPTSVPLKCPRHHDQGEVPVKLPCMWMHHLSSSSASNLVFESIFGTSNLENFWEAMPMQDKRLKGHPMLKKHNWKRRCIPLLLHADAAEFQSTDSLMTVSFRGLLMSPAWKSICGSFPTPRAALPMGKMVQNTHCIHGWHGA